MGNLRKRLLLDTCTLLWLAGEPEKVSTAAADTIGAQENSLFVSLASVWEISLKIQSGKIALPNPLRSWLREQKSKWMFSYVPIRLGHVLRNNEISELHRDPFDRLLVCQAIMENLAIVTPDPAIKKYPVDVVW